MDTVLISVTLVSLGLAGAMAVLVARLLRDERKRSDARVETLIELASQSAEQVAERPANAARAPVRTDVASRATVAAPAAPSRAGVERALDDFEIRPHGTVAVADIFAEPTRSSPWGRRFAVIGALAVLGGAVFGGLSLQQEGTGGGAARTSTTARVIAAPAAPLELVSLRHTQDRDTLTITGLVQNPKAGSPRMRLSVTAVVLSPDGTLLASGKAPLDYTSLGPGDESPFVVTVPVRGAVARYRIGFRSEDGSVVAHIDRRPGDVSRAGL